MHTIPLTAARAADVLNAGRRLAAPSALKREAGAIVTALVLYPLAIAGNLVPALVDRIAKPPTASNATPFVLVHGWGAVKSHWLPLLVGLDEAGFASVSTVGYNSTFEDVPHVAQRLVDHVDEIIAETGAQRVHLVGHSMGGVIVRYAVEVLGLGNRVALAATIAAPHGGTMIGHIGWLHGRWGRASRQLAHGSQLLRQIETAARTSESAATTERPTTWLALHSSADTVVAGRAAKIRTPNATNLEIVGCGHIGIMMDERTVSAVVLAATCADADRTPLDAAA